MVMNYSKSSDRWLARFVAMVTGELLITLLFLSIVPLLVRGRTV